ncbi:MAG TPA: VOC family protein [Gemmatimonadota bacterium]|nr:VOC family protein [Gemmatimonadota bacterium]
MTRDRLPGGTHPGRIRLQVADLERSLAYYEGILGLRRLEETGGAASLGADRPLVELRERPGAAPAPRGGRPGLYHFALLVPDRATLGGLARHLAGAGVPLGASDHLVSEALYLRDPDGLGIEVYRDRPRSSWRRRGGQLVMATEPLDLEDLRRAGDGADWDGMPAGTTVGHVHLHVGDLEMAARFYEEGLGLERTVWSYPGALFLSAGGYHHHLGLNTWAASDRPPGEGDARLLEWELLVPDAGAAAAALGSLEGAGHEIERGASGGLVRDPWGTALRLGAEPPAPVDGEAARR